MGGVGWGDAAAAGAEGTWLGGMQMVGVRVVSGKAAGRQTVSLPHTVHLTAQTHLQIPTRVDQTCLKGCAAAGGGHRARYARRNGCLAQTRLRAVTLHLKPQGRKPSPPTGGVLDLSYHHIFKSLYPNRVHWQAPQAAAGDVRRVVVQQKPEPPAVGGAARWGGGWGAGKGRHEQCPCQLQRCALRPCSTCAAPTPDTTTTTTTTLTRPPTTHPAARPPTRA